MVFIFVLLVGFVTGLNGLYGQRLATSNWQLERRASGQIRRLRPLMNFCKDH